MIFMQVQCLFCMWTGIRFLQVDGLYRLMNGEHSGPINLGNPGALWLYTDLSCTWPRSKRSCYCSLKIQLASHNRGLLIWNRGVYNVGACRHSERGICWIMLKWLDCVYSCRFSLGLAAYRSCRRLISGSNCSWLSLRYKPKSWRTLLMTLASANRTSLRPPSFSAGSPRFESIPYLNLMNCFITILVCRDHAAL